MMYARTALAAVFVMTPCDAVAHAFGSRYDLPLPLGLYLAAAGAAVLLSFAGALVFLRHGKMRLMSVDVPVGRLVAGTADKFLGAAGLFLFLLVLGAAAFGPPEAVNNFATVWIWVIWWVGYLLLSALAVSTWPAVDPFRRIAGSLSPLIRGRSNQPRILADVAGWLAPIGIFAIAWLELVSDMSENPAAMGFLVAVYLAIAVAGNTAYGAAWFNTADPISRVFMVFGRMAPASASGSGSLRFRPLGEGLLDGPPPPRGEIALVTGLIGIVLFDGLSETPAWAAVLDFVSESESLRPALLWLRGEGVDLLKLVRTAGLVVTIASFMGAYWSLILAMRAIVGPGHSISSLGHDFCGSLLPIAVAYHLSHYISYLMIAGQLILPAASDPFGLGWNLFGTRNWSIDITVIGAEQVWWIAFVSLIAGHGLSVIVAHRRALQVFSDRRMAAMSQLPMTLAMVGLTVLSLWILSQPIIA